MAENLVLKILADASQAKKETGGFASSLKSITKTATAVSAALTSVGVTVYKLIETSVDYAIEVGNLASSLGTTTEEASSLMEMASSLGVSMSSLEMGFRKMAQKGIDPSIEGLIEVKKQLSACKSPAEKLALAQELLGRSGAELIPVFDQLTDEQLRDYVRGLTDAQRVTRAEYEEALRMRDALDTWGDAFDSLKLTIGNFLVEGLLPVIQGINDLINVTGEHHDALIASASTWEEYQALMEEQSGVFRALTNELTSAEFSQRKLEDATKSAADMSERQASKLREAIRAVEDTEATIKSLTDAEYLQKAVEALLAGDLELAQHYADVAAAIRSEKDAVKALTQALADLDGKKITAEIMVLTNQIGGAGGGFSAAQMQAALGEQYAAEAQAALASQWKQETGGSSIQGVNGKWYPNAIIKNGAIWTVSPHPYPGNTGVKPAGFQHGGEFVVGGSGGADSQSVGFMATPGERVKVTPPGAEDNTALLDAMRTQGDEIKGIRDEIRWLVRFLPTALRDALA